MTEVSKPWGPSLRASVFGLSYAELRDKLDEHPHLRGWLRTSIQQELFPDWTTEAACRRSGPEEGITDERFFAEDIAQKRNPDDYDFPRKVRAAMAICAACPVRRECLEYAFESEHHVQVGQIVETTKDDDRRYGVLGGIPGRIREHFARRPDRIQACDSWFQTYAEDRRWVTSPDSQQEGVA